MARLDITPIVADDSGVVMTTTAGTVDGHSIPNAGSDVILVLFNSGAGSHTVTAVTPKTIDDLAIPDRTITLAAGQRKVAGPFGSNLYGQTGTDAGELWLNFDATQSEVQVTAIKWPRG